MPHFPTTQNAMNSLIERALDRQLSDPVARFVTPEDLSRQIDFTLPKEGMSVEEVFALLDAVADATPRTASPRFLNQLFGGWDDAALAGELLSVALNTSMYTYKAAGANAIIERELTRHMARIVGFTEGEGVFAPGGSMSNFTAIILARNEAQPAMRDGGHNGEAMIIYTSDVSHYSITKGAAMAGMGRRNVRRIACDERGRMIPSELRAAIVADLAAGALPTMINATAGTTVLGSFDPIREIATIAKDFGIWLHVDGALGSTMLLSETCRHLLDGIELADSVTWDAHKLMTVPLVCSVILVKRPGLLAKHFNEDAAYLFQSDDEGLNFGTRAMQCGRRNDALKLWALWKRYGDHGLGRRLDHLVALARHAADIIRADQELELVKEPESVNVCFEVRGVDSAELCEELRRRNCLIVGYGDVEGRDVLRIPFVNADLTFAQVDEAIEDIRDLGVSMRGVARRREPVARASCCP